MKPVTFEEQNVTYAENQPEYIPLPVFRDTDGTLISCWKPTPEELKRINETGEVWVSVMTFNKALQPLYVTGIKEEVLKKNDLKDIEDDGN